MLINTIRLLANLFMSGFIRSFRLRSLYFISVGTTAVCLGFLGLLQHPQNPLQVNPTTYHALKLPFIKQNSIKIDLNKFILYFRRYGI